MWSSPVVRCAARIRRHLGPIHRLCSEGVNTDGLTLGGGLIIRGVNKNPVQLTATSNASISGVPSSTAARPTRPGMRGQILLTDSASSVTLGTVTFAVATGSSVPYAIKGPDGTKVAGGPLLINYPCPPCWSSQQGRALPGTSAKGHLHGPVGGGISATGDIKSAKYLSFWVRWPVPRQPPCAARRLMVRPPSAQSSTTALRCQRPGPSYLSVNDGVEKFLIDKDGFSYQPTASANDLLTLTADTALTIRGNRPASSGNANVIVDLIS